jgi:hypothetical protein
MKVAWLACGLSALLCGCAATLSRAVPALSVTDLPVRNVIRVTNNGDAAARLYYLHLDDFGPLQMFYVRFRDRDGGIFPIDGTRDGWFTAKVHYASLQRVPRRRLIVPAHGSIEFPRELNIYFAGAARWAGPRDRGPCQVQIKLAGLLDNDPRRPVEALSDWQPGPCPT